MVPKGPQGQERERGCSPPRLRTVREREEGKGGGKLSAQSTLGPRCAARASELLRGAVLAHNNPLCFCRLVTVSKFHLRNLRRNKVNTESMKLTAYKRPK